MNAIELANFLGWCTLLNFGMLIFAALILVLAHKPVARIHGHWFQIEPTELSRIYFSFLANYKLLILVFNLMPYLALRIMGQS